MYNQYIPIRPQLQELFTKVMGRGGGGMCLSPAHCLAATSSSFDLTTSQSASRQLRPRFLSRDVSSQKAARVAPA